MLRDFFKEINYDARPVLIIGKGPSFSRINEVNLSDYNVFTLNQCVRETVCDYAHIIDFDVMAGNEDAIYKNCKYLLVPYWMHFGYRPVKEVPTSKLVESHEFLKKMNDEGRLLCYNLSTAYKHGLKVGDSLMVKAKHYSAEAVVDLVSKWGAKTIRTAGVDGGTEQSESFSDLENLNKERGYDLQWQGIRKSISRFDLDYAPLGVESPIRIFVGAGEHQLIPALVLKHSILKHCTMSCQVTPMIDWTHPLPKDPRNHPRTPFSFQRFMIPEKCGYQGHAIYMDSDMLVFSDVKEIWEAPMRVSILTMRHDDVDKHKAKFSVYKMSCDKNNQPIEKIIYDLNNGWLTYESLVFDFKHGHGGWEDGFNPDWNSLEEYTPGKTKLLHYTEMYNQPWLRNPNHPLGHLWFNELTEAVKDGSIDRKLVEEHVSKGSILPKCLEVLNA